MTLIEFLRARLDEDAGEIAKHPDDHGWPADWQIVATEESNYPALPLLQITKKRALAEVDAKRRILDEHRMDSTGLRAVCDVCADPPAYEARWRDWPCTTLRLLSLPYADHPDYREEWRP
jgi:hypothetical protein